MIQIEDLRLVDALAQSPSLSAAARSLNVTPPARSARLRKLEARAARWCGCSPTGSATVRR